MTNSIEHSARPLSNYQLHTLQADGILIVKTKQAILVAVYVAPIQAAEATPVVEGLADYLISVNY